VDSALTKEVLPLSTWPKIPTLTLIILSALGAAATPPLVVDIPRKGVTLHSQQRHRKVVLEEVQDGNEHLSE